MATLSTTVILIFLILWIILNLYYYRREGERGLKTYYGIFGILRTSWGLKIIDKIGKYRFWQKIGIFLIPVCVVVSIITFYTFVNSTVGLFSGSIPKESSRPIILLFGNVIPWIPGIIALVLGITLHELAHGIVARSFNLKIKSTGLILFLGIPLGAFVEIGEEFKNVSRKVRGAVASAGPVVNILIYLLVLLVIPCISNITSPLTITKVFKDLPASGVLKEGDIIRVGPTYHNKIVVFGKVIGRDDINHILLINVMGVASVPNIKVETVAIKEKLIWIEPTTKIKDTARILYENSISGVPVISNGKLVGVFTYHDLAHAISKNMENQPVEKVMTRDPITITPDKKIYDALILMEEKDIGRLIVVDKDGRVVGIITKTDVLKLIGGALFNKILKNIKGD